MIKKGILQILWQLCLIVLIISIAYADFGLMLGSFRNKDNAENYMVNFLKNQKNREMNGFLEEIQMSGKGIWYRACLGPFDNESAALKQQEILRSHGFDSVVVLLKSSVKNIFSVGTIDEKKERPLEQPKYAKRSPKKLPPLVPADSSGAVDMGSKKIEFLKNDVNRSKRSESAPVQVNPLVRVEKDSPPSIPVIPADSVDPVNEAVTISPGDILKIEIPGQKQMSRNYDVDPDGRIFLMSVGEIRVAGLNVADLEKMLAKQVKAFIGKAEKPSIRILERKRYINIEGGVNYPGWYRVSQLSTLEDLIEMAGGLVSGVDYSGIRLKRQIKKGYREIKVKGEIALDANDILVVPTPKKFEKRVDSGDLLFINIPEKAPMSELSEIQRRVVQNQIEVDRNGYIYIPDYGHIYVNNLSTEEISKIITDRLPKYLARAAKVHVNIIEKRQYVQIVGYVKNPGWYNVPETDNIQSALTAAGGAIDGAIMSNISVTRKWGGRVHRTKINLYQFNITGDPRLLTPLHENDVLFVPISSAFGDVKRTLGAWGPPQEKLEEDIGTKVRIFGAVTHPGIYEPKEDMNILDLLISAGGNTINADLAKTLLIRESKSEIYDLNALILQSSQGSAIIPKVQNGDSVYIGYMKLSGQEITEPKKMVRIFGGVEKPGVFEPVPDMTLMDIFSLANGGTYDADLTKVMIMRRDGTMERFDLQEYFDSKAPDPSSLPKVYASDTIYVAYLQHLGLEKKEPIYLLGKVKTPGQYDLAEGGMTVYQMIAYAGGLDEWADTENIRIIRMVNGRQQNIPFNLKKALSGKFPELNIRLRSFDTIYVP